MNVVDFTPKAVAAPGQLVPLARRWLEHLAARNYAVATRNAYRTDLEQFVGYCQQRGLATIGEVTPALLDDWLAALTHGAGMKPRTAARKLESVRGLLRHALRNGLLAADPAADIQVRFDAERVIAPSTEALQQVIEGIPAQGFVNLRDRALFRLMFDSALRIDGLRLLDAWRADAPPRWTVTPDGVVTYRAKGGRTETASAGDKTLDYLRQWLAVRPDSAVALFCARGGRRLSAGGIHARAKHWGARAGLPDLHCHLFRHRRLGDVYESSGDARLAADLGGHRNVQTFLNTYGHQAASVTRARLQSVCPLG